MTKWHGTTNDNLSERGRSLIIISVSYSTTECAGKIVDDLNFAQVIKSHVNRSLSEFNTSITAGPFKTKAQHPIDSITLDNHWNISKDRARQTIKKTTQRGARKVLHTSLSHRYPTNDRGLRYDRTNHPLFTDKLIAGTTSKRGNKYSQVYGTSFRWARAHPMKFKREAHRTLSVMFKRDGVPQEMVIDG